MPRLRRAPHVTRRRSVAKVGILKTGKNYLRAHGATDPTPAPKCPCHPTPVRRAALLSVDRSPTIAANLARLDRTLRRQIDRAFDLEPDALDAVDAAASWDAWNRLRHAQGCSVARARRVLTRTISSLIEGAA